MANLIVFFRGTCIKMVEPCNLIKLELCKNISKFCFKHSQFLFSFHMQYHFLSLFLGWNSSILFNIHSLLFISFNIHLTFIYIHPSVYIHFNSCIHEKLYIFCTYGINVIVNLGFFINKGITPCTLLERTP